MEWNNYEKEQIRRVNFVLRTMSLEEVLRWSYEKFHSRGLVPVTSFGLSGLVILHMMEQLGFLHKLISLDTLHLFPETYNFIHRWNGSHEADVFLYKPQGASNKQEFDFKYGSDFHIKDPSRFAFVTKVEPLQRALSEHRVMVWITGRRRSQGAERSQLEILEIDKSSVGTRRLKLNPLAYWSFEEVWDYVKKNNIPYNPLYDQGYMSVGDVISTSPTLNNKERSGRFRNSNSTECGIH
jgi:phosphoadenosine phosphosulfate reductase